MVHGGAVIRCLVAVHRQVHPALAFLAQLPEELGVDAPVGASIACDGGGESHSHRMEGGKAQLILGVCILTLVQGPGLDLAAVAGDGVAIGDPVAPAHPVQGGLAIRVEPAIAVVVLGTAVGDPGDLHGGVGIVGLQVKFQGDAHLVLEQAVYLGPAGGFRVLRRCQIVGDVDQLGGVTGDGHRTGIIAAALGARGAHLRPLGAALVLIGQLGVAAITGLHIAGEAPTDGLARLHQIGPVLIVGLDIGDPAHVDAGQSRHADPQLSRVVGGGVGVQLLRPEGQGVCRLAAVERHRFLISVIRDVPPQREAVTSPGYYYIPLLVLAALQLGPHGVACAVDQMIGAVLIRADDLVAA